MEVHAAHGGGVSVERVQALARLGVPHFQRAVRAAADDDVALHLRRPDAARVTHQRPQALPERKEHPVVHSAVALESWSD